MSSDRLYQIALTLVPMVGDLTAKKLIAYCGSAEAVFKESQKSLMSIPGVGSVLSRSIASHQYFSRAEAELDFIQKNAIQCHYFTEAAYPYRLKQCEDAPILIYMKGEVDLNSKRVVSVVGTRKATDYGRQVVDELIKGLSDLEDVMVVSGLAYGIDVAAHKASLKYKIPTLGVLAHGLDRVYPSIHSSVAIDMQKEGGLLSDFMSGTSIERENFPKRNRIIAGLSDATVVVEARKKGGALITSDIANSYHRDVFAVPGRIGDENSEGCNTLIRRNQAALIQSAEDLNYLMGWEADFHKKEEDKKDRWDDLNEQEKVLMLLLSDKEKWFIDDLNSQVDFSPSEMMSLLLNLELKGLLKSLPGNQYLKV